MIYRTLFLECAIFRIHLFWNTLEPRMELARILKNKILQYWCWIYRNI